MNSIRSLKSNLFLKARWENLILITYAIDPDILTGLLPQGVTPDTAVSSSSAAEDYHQQQTLLINCL